MRPCYSSLRHEGVLGIGKLVGYLFYQEYLFAHSARYARDDFDGDAREVISNLNGCFGSIFSQLYEWKDRFCIVGERIRKFWVGH